MHIVLRHFNAVLALAVVLAAGLFAVASQLARAETGQDTIRIALIPLHSYLGNKKAYGPLIRELEKETGLSFEWVQSETYDDTIEKLRLKRADIAYLGPLSYVRAQDEFGVRLIARTLDKQGAESYFSWIIARKDSELDSLESLKGKRFAFTDPNSTSGFLIPMVELEKQGVDLDDFASVSYLKKHPNSLLAVYNGQVDAGALASNAVDMVTVDLDQIQILWRSAPIYRGPWVARAGLSDERYETIRAALLRISSRDDAAEIFENSTTKGFVDGEDADYDVIREVLRLKQSMEDGG